jgi:hypothetical protein
VIPVPLAIIPVPVAIPVVVVAEAAAISLPVTLVEPLSIVARHHPDGARIGWPSPITVMPPVTASHWIPIAFYPDVSGARDCWPDTNHTGGGGAPMVTPTEICAPIADPPSSSNTVSNFVLILNLPAGPRHDTFQTGA